MTTVNEKPSDVVEIENWLNAKNYKINANSEEDNINYLEATKEYNSHSFELKIEYERERSTVFLCIHCLEPIKSSNYSLCMEFLNHLNDCKSKVKYTLHPDANTLSVSTVIPFANWEVHDWIFTHDLEIHESPLLKELGKIYSLLVEEDICLQGMRERIKFYL